MTEIRVAYPIDVSAVRDKGMASLVVLAASLGWNVMHKNNQPVVITARDGIQDRIPTNTSIRASVFQTTLSKIIAHAGKDHKPTIDLIDDIIKRHKPSVDQARLLRLAVGETPQQHRDRVAAHESPAVEKREPEPHLTQKPSLASLLPELGDPPMRPATVVTTNDLAPPEKEPLVSIVSEKPYQAHGKEGATYTSGATIEKLWSDGSRSYACNVCGAAFSTPKGVGAHRQVHIRKGEATANYRDFAKHQTGFDPEWVVTPHAARLAAEIDAALKALGRDASGRDLASWIYQQRPDKPPVEDPANLTSDEILDRISNLLDRSRARQLEQQVGELEQQLINDRKELLELRDWRRALRELVEEEG